MKTGLQFNPYRILSLFVLSWLMLPAEIFANDRPAKLPGEYRFIGNYKLISKMRVESGQAVPVVISPLVYQVYSDGMEVRVYCLAAGDEGFTSYAIYRSDGIGVARQTGEIDIVAGVQAYCTKGEMVRQLSVTRNSLTMVKMPPRSHRVIVTRAKAVKATATSDESPQTKDTGR